MQPPRRAMYHHDWWVSQLACGSPACYELMALVCSLQRVRTYERDVMFERRERTGYASCSGSEGNTIMSLKHLL